MDSAGLNSAKLSMMDVLLILTADQASLAIIN